MTLSKRVRDAIELMVFGGDDGKPLTRQDAAATVGLADASLRLAFRNPEVVKHWNEQLEVLRTSARPRAFIRMTQLSEQDEAKAVAFQASKHLLTDGKDDDGGGVHVNVNVVNQQPGYVIAVDPRFADELAGEQQPQRLTPDAAKPLIEHVPVPPRR